MPNAFVRPVVGAWRAEILLYVWKIVLNVQKEEFSHLHFSSDSLGKAELGLFSQNI